MRDMALRFHDVGKTYPGGKVALSDVSLELPSGRFVALIGPNGAGKSTFINLACGVLTPTQGTVEVCTDEPADIGWCSQTQMVDWYLSVRDNVLMGARFAGLGRREAQVATTAILSLLDMDGFADKKCDFLSGGQLQRVQIARAMVHDPRVLILDEPTVGLDVEVCDRLLGELRRRAAQGTTVIVSSHDLDFLERYCDDVLFISGGQVVAFEGKQDFLHRFASTDLVTVSYEGHLEEAALNRLREHVLSVDQASPLQVTMPRGHDLAQVLRVLTRHVNVIDVTRERQGLREAYLNLQHAERSA